MHVILYNIVNNSADLEKIMNIITIPVSSGSSETLPKILHFNLHLNQLKSGKDPMEHLESVKYVISI
jgi:hypothetical protein